jgi:hypothetical protein
MAANLVRVFTESSPPLGFTNATGQVTSAIPTLNDIRTGNFTSNGWSSSGQRRNSYAQRSLSRTTTNATVRRPSQAVVDLPTINAEISPEDEVQAIPPNDKTPNGINGLKGSAIVALPLAPNRTASGDPLYPVDMIEDANAAATPPPPPVPHDPGVPYPNGYQFPPKHSAWKSTQIGLKAFSKFVITPFGFVITVYGLNVVAWGGMLFLVLVGAAPAMCHPSCSDINSAAKKWIEIDSQILNALFCVTGLGLIPWRFRDLYYLLQYRWQRKESGIRRLAGIHSDWFRLQGSQDVPIDFDPKSAIAAPPGVDESALALPIKNSPPAPLTWERAPPSKYWKLDFMIWCYVWNTFLQIALCGVMWGLNRFNRPGWTTGLLISLACIVAMAGGYMAFRESKAVKKIEGVPVSEEDLEILHQMQDAEKRGIFPLVETPDKVA